MTTVIKKWGNSLAVRIPHDAAENIGLVEGSSVVVEQKGASLVLRPVGHKKFLLSELLKGITKENRHELVD